MKNNLLITGIPRSGTSLLCRLIDDTKNCCAINEPAEIFQYLKYEDSIVEFESYYSRLRADIESGKPIKNKLYKGKVITDTKLLDEYVEYVAQVEDTNFVLATKNTISYLSRLDRIMEIAPDIHVVALVRDPVATIHSWINSFDHLKNVSVQSIPVGGVNDSMLPQDEKVRLETIENEKSPWVRKAMFWNHLAEVILKHSSRIQVFTYDELIEAPYMVLEKIFEEVGRKDISENLDVLVSPNVRTPKKKSLSHEETLLVQEICKESSKKLGVLKV